MKQQQTASDSLHPPVIAGVPTGGESRGFFDYMKYNFDSEYATEVFINGNNGITISQDQIQETAIVVFGSRRRAEQVAEAILNLAKFARFESNEEQEPTNEAIH